MQEALAAAVATAAPLLATALLTLLGTLLALATQELRKKLQSERANTILARFDNLVEAVVLEQKQTVVDELKRKADDGQLTSAEVKEVLETAKTKLALHLGTTGIKELMSAFGFSKVEDLDSLMNTKIEAAVASAA